MTPSVPPRAFFCSRGPDGYMEVIYLPVPHRTKQSQRTTRRHVTATLLGGGAIYTVAKLPRRLLIHTHPQRLPSPDNSETCRRCNSTTQTVQRLGVGKSSHCWVSEKHDRRLSPYTGKYHFDRYIYTILIHILPLCCRREDVLTTRKVFAWWASNMYMRKSAESYCL